MIVETGNPEKKRGALHDLRLHLLLLSHVALMFVPFALCWALYYASRIYLPFFRRGDWFVMGIFALVYTLFCQLYGGFQLSSMNLSELIYSQILAAGISDGFLYLLTLLLTRGIPVAWPMLLVFAVHTMLAVAWSSAAVRIDVRWHPPLRTVVVWDGAESREGRIAGLIRTAGLERRFSVEESWGVEDFLRRMEADGAEASPFADGSALDAVFLDGIHSHARDRILKFCVVRNIRAYIIPRVGDVLINAAREAHLFYLPILVETGYAPSPEYLFFKRAFDIAASAAALILLSPLMAVTALLIRTDGGPIFYRQKRLTRDGQIFEIIKFRSMRVDAEKDGIARLSTGEHDDRITPVGRIIRKFRIDELPQFFNIFLGSMSLVGPRPERPELAAEYEKTLPEFRLRLQCKAGLTGRAQVYGKYNTTPGDKLLMDLQYIAHPGMVEDLKIMFATIKILFMAESTEGIAVGQTTAMEGGGAGDPTEGKN